MTKTTTLESNYQGYSISVSDGGTYDPEWDTRTIYFSIFSPDGGECMTRFVMDTGDTLETYMDIMKMHVDGALRDPHYWTGDDDEDDE